MTSQQLLQRCINKVTANGVPIRGTWAAIAAATSVGRSHLSGVRRGRMGFSQETANKLLAWLGEEVELEPAKQGRPLWNPPEWAASLPYEEMLSDPRWPEAKPAAATLKKWRARVTGSGRGEGHEKKSLTYPPRDSILRRRGDDASSESPMNNIPANISNLVSSAARGDYQKELLTGEQSWSGSTLKGKAREYSGRYAESRRALVDRIGEKLAGTGWKAESEIVKELRGARRLVLTDAAGVKHVW